MAFFNPLRLWRERREARAREREEQRRQLMGANIRLRKAASRGDIGGIRAAIAEGARELDEALRAAARRGCVQAAVYLLAQGASPKVFQGWASRTATESLLVVTARRGNVSIIELAIQSDSINESIDNLLRESVSHGRVETARFMLDAHANIYSLERSDVLAGLKAGGVEMGRFLLEHSSFASWREELADAVAEMEMLAEASQSEHPT
jgi:hypothetical protein